MISTELQPVVNTVLRRAQRQGYVVPREVRAELTEAGLPDARWRDVLAMARESLHYRQGRYFYLDAVSPRLQQQQSREHAVAAAARQVIRGHLARVAEQERRQQERIEFFQPVTLLTEDGRRVRLLSRDLSPTGMRLLGTRSLLGQKVRLTLTVPGKSESVTFVLRVLWTCAVGDDLFENGGSFVDVLPEGSGELRVIGS